MSRPPSSSACLTSLMVLTTLLPNFQAGSVSQVIAHDLIALLVAALLFRLLRLVAVYWLAVGFILSAFQAARSDRAHASISPDRFLKEFQ
ncbi:hypothetical protein [Lignipirellula cremea]|uniref:Uncharacterized protein n=1 Tax=Lignipirellula cremea TaxID=2528010 RepID=A0A518E3G2_9BACT|nr:hypothetical protein [Lignipirellula cremea]QDU98628.1 hypothetical protein Pla8534_64990 [Lignipirellula cremea]